MNDLNLLRSASRLNPAPFLHFLAFAVIVNSISLGVFTKSEMYSYHVL